MSSGWPDDRKKMHYVCDTVSLLQVPVKNIHSRRALLYKVADDIAARQKLKTESRRLTPSCEQFWTKNAWDLYITNGNCSGLHLEHVVPKGVVTDWLFGADHVLEDPVKDVDVSRAIDLFMVTCWVTGPKHKRGDKNWGSEQDVLDATWCGIKCKDKMPGTWLPSSGGIWARYEFVKDKSNGKLSDWKMRSDHEKCSQPSP